MGAESRGFDGLVVSGLRFIAAALLKPFAGTLVVWVARSGAKNHDGYTNLLIPLLCYANGAGGI